MISFDDFVVAERNTGEPDCTGLVFKAEKRTYIDKRGACVVTEKFIPLHRKSCHCTSCGATLDALTEYVACGDTPFYNSCEDGKLYTIEFFNESRDWETGYIDDYDLKFVKLED